MPLLGGHQELRGFDYARFTDLNSILLAAEYRAEVWMGMDLALFYDAGKVFADHRDFNLSNLRSDYGFGIRMKTEQSTFLRFDMAFGGEGTKYYVVFDSPFDDLSVFRRVLRNLQ
jgi:outer membrane protein assembly factor BamA